MASELVYTSAPRGLKSGSRGFCTVEATTGMPPALVAALEGLSGYRHIAPPGDASNPVVFSHVTFSLAGRNYSIVSRIGDAGNDYTGRTNKLAHHLVLGPGEQPPGGPAWLLGQPNLLRRSFEGEPRTLPPRKVPSGDRSAGSCAAWQAAAGDAGWAGVLAEAYLTDPQRLAYIVVPPGLDVRRLFEEAIALLPPERRWGVTFTTLYSTLPQSVNCLWRAVLAGSKEAHESRRFVQALRIDLSGPLASPPPGDAVTVARAGQMLRLAETKPTAPSLPKGKSPAADLAAAASLLPADTPLDQMPSAPRPQRLIEPLMAPPELRPRRSKRTIMFAGGAMLCLLMIGGAAVWGFGRLSKFGNDRATNPNVAAGNESDNSSAEEPAPKQNKPQGEIDKNEATAATTATVAPTVPQQPVHGDPSTLQDVPGTDSALGSPSETVSQNPTGSEVPFGAMPKADPPRQPVIEENASGTDGKGAGDKDAAAPEFAAIPPTLHFATFERLGDDTYRLKSDGLDQDLTKSRMAIWIPSPDSEQDTISSDFDKELTVGRPPKPRGTLSIAKPAENWEILYLPNNKRGGNPFEFDLKWSVLTVLEGDHEHRFVFWEQPNSNQKLDKLDKDDQIWLPLPPKTHLETLPATTATVVLEIDFPGRGIERFEFHSEAPSTEKNRQLRSHEFEAALLDLFEKTFVAPQPPIQQKSQSDVDFNAIKKQHDVNVDAMKEEKSRAVTELQNEMQKHPPHLRLVLGTDAVVTVSPEMLFKPFEEMVNRWGNAFRLLGQKNQQWKSFKYKAVVAQTAPKFDDFRAQLPASQPGSQSPPTTDFHWHHRKALDDIESIAQWSASVREAKLTKHAITYEVQKGDGTSITIPIWEWTADQPAEAKSSSK